MDPECAEARHLDDRDVISFVQLVQLSGLEEEELRELVDYGALAPVDPDATSWTFHARTVVIARTACRLRDDLELDPPALSVILRLLERIETLADELSATRARGVK